VDGGRRGQQVAMAGRQAMAGTTQTTRRHSNDAQYVMDGDRDRELLLEALELERQAARRYVSHAAGTSDPRLVAYWESLRRNESEHRDLLAKELRRLGVTVPPETQDREAPGPGADPSEVGR